MPSVNDTFEIYLLCDAFGTVEKIIDMNNYSDSLFETGQNFTANIKPHSITKSLSFLQEVNTENYALNYEFTFLPSEGEQAHMLTLNGFKICNMIFLIVTGASTEFNPLDEISKLNNELINTQRELAKKNEAFKKLNVELERLATKDTLTGLYNRRFLFELFADEKLRAQRLKLTISLVMIDINQFKMVNDQLGHSEGDKLLQIFAGLAMQLTRQGMDHVFRMGGDEFLILMTDCSKENALKVANRLNEIFITFTDIASLSYGVIELEPGFDNDLDNCLKAADDLMYVYKREIKLKQKMS